MSSKDSLRFNSSYSLAEKKNSLVTILQARIGLIIVLFLYGCIGTIYSVTMPIYEALDEFPHFAYVQHIVQGRGLPELDVKDSTHLVHQEVAQPPLYYIIGALGTFALPTTNLRDVPVNPHCRSGVPAFGEENRNLYVHSFDEQFPYQGNALAVHVLRWLSLLMGAGVVISTYFLALRIKPGSRVFPILASVFTAFNPQFLFLSSSVNNDNLVTLLGNVGFLLIVHLLTDKHTWRLFAMLGFVTAFAILAKPGGLALIPISGLVMVMLFWQDRSITTFFQRVVVYFVPVAVVAGWWFVRNMQIYNEPFAFTAHEVFGVRVPGISPFELLTREGQGLWTSYWGVFGAFNVLAHPLMYVVFNVVTILAILGLLFGLILGVKKGQWRTWFYWSLSSVSSGIVVLFVFLWLILMIAALMSWSLKVPASQGRLIFPAIGAASTLLALGLVQWPIPRWLLAWGSALAMIIIAILIPFMVFIPTYDKPALASSISLGEIPNPVHVTFDGKLELLGYRLNRAKVTPGGFLAVECYWRVIAPMEKDYSIYVHAMEADGQGIGQVDVYPMGGAYRMSEFKAGQGFVDVYRVRIDSDAKGPGVGRFVLGVYEVATMSRLPAVDGQGNPLFDAPIGNYKIQTTPSIQIQPTRALNAAFGQQIQLLGIDLPAERITPGEAIHGSLVWQAVGTPAKDYTVFVQLVSTTDLVAQFDSPPMKGSFPTSWWEKGDTITDSFVLQVPRSASKGSFRLIAGLYDPVSGERVPVNGTDHLEITNITID